MTIGGGVTAFVTDAAGFVGMELVKVLVAGGHQVFGLVPSVDAAHRLRRVGATAVMGDLVKPGQWQDEAGTEWVFHVPSEALTQEICGGRRQAGSLMRDR